MNFIDKKREIIKFNIYYWMFFLIFCSVFGIFLYISIFDGFCGVCIFLILAMVGCLLMLELAKEAFINIKTIAGLEEMKDKLDILEENNNKMNRELVNYIRGIKCQEE